jgi:peptidoglycan hydrolase-like protein with peptidoglycan-binding domain
MSKGTALIQEGLISLGYAPGKADGLFGAKTEKALWEYLSKKGAPMLAPAAPVSGIPAQADVRKFYGEAGGPECTAGRCVLPTPFYLAWAPSEKLTGFSCHRLVAEALTLIFSEAFAHYGAERFSALRLDCFGGCYNYRVMRGGTSLSMHSWGIAVDLDPERNQLKWGRDKAEFAKPVYEPFWKIVEAYDGVSLGRQKNYDWMHFQFAKV